MLQKHVVAASTGHSCWTAVPGLSRARGRQQPSKVGCGHAENTQPRFQSRPPRGLGCRRIIPQVPTPVTQPASPMRRQHQGKLIHHHIQNRCRP